MATLNKTMLMGRLTNNPEMKSLSNGSVTKFRFAVGRSKKNAETGQYENDSNPLYIDCEAFGRPDSKRNLADLISQYCKQGDQVFIEGRLVLDQWEDKNGGGKRSKHKIVVDNVEFLGGKIPGVGDTNDKGRETTQYNGGDQGGDDENSIPF